MWLLVVNFIKDKVLSLGGIFIIILLAIIAIFIFSNSNVILSKFGFETTTKLKAELVQTQNDLNTVVTINERMLTELNTLNSEYIKNTNALIKTEEELVKNKATVEELKNKLDSKVTPAISVVDRGTTKTPTTTTVITADYDKVSTINIESINESYAKLFTDQGGK